MVKTFMIIEVDSVNNVTRTYDNLTRNDVVKFYNKLKEDGIYRSNIFKVVPCYELEDFAKSSV